MAKNMKTSGKEDKLKQKAQELDSSPFAYNAALVNSVTQAYGTSQDSGLEMGLAGGITKFIKGVASASKKRKDELMAQNVGKDANVKNFNQTEVANLVKFKNNYDDIAKKLSRPFLSKDKKAELNAELNNLNRATGNYINGVNHLASLQDQAIKGDKSRSNAYDYQQHMTWDRFATGEARAEAANNIDFKTGDMSIQDPYKSDGEKMNILGWSALKEVDSKWLSNDTKTSKASNSLAKDLSIDRDVAEQQLTEQITNNYYNNPSAIWDHASNRNNEFAQYLMEDDDFEEALESYNDGSESGEAVTLANNDDPAVYDVVTQAARKMDISKQWLDFRTKKQMEQFDKVRADKNRSMQEKDSSGVSDSDKQKAELFVRAFNSGEKIYFKDGSYAVRSMVGKNQSTDARYELFTKSGQFLKQPGSTSVENPAGASQKISFNDLINKVGLPNEYIKQLDKRFTPGGTFNKLP